MNPFQLRAPFLALFLFAASSPGASFYTQRLNDPKAIYLSPSGGDDTAALQTAINQVQEANRQGIVLLGPGNYHLRDTIYVWPSIRVIGYGEQRPVVRLDANTTGFTNAEREKMLFFFAGRRRLGDGGPVADANPGTFYSALANFDIQIEDGNVGAAAVRAHYAQHCFLAHMDFRLGPALAGIHEGGNVVEDVRFFSGEHAIETSKPSPGWQFTLVDCVFEGQRGAAILEHEAGLTLIRPRFRQVPCAVEIERDWADELWVKDARLEDVAGPAFIVSLENSPRTEINLETAACRNVPTFARLRASAKSFAAPAPAYTVDSFSHGLVYSSLVANPKMETHFDATPQSELSPPVASDLTPPPPCDTWFNIADAGAKGDGRTDDTEAFQNAIAAHRAIYLPSGFYVVRDTLQLRPDTALIGLHPGATQIILLDNTRAYQGVGGPKALVETPHGGSNVIIGIGLYTSGANPRAVAALWKAGASSLMNDVRFLGGHGTPLPGGGRAIPYNENHSADPDPNRRWDSQYPSLWVTDGGGGTFLDIWTPSTFAQAGMRVSDTDTPGRAYQISSEHHVRNEVQFRRAAHWSVYALQTEEERGESGFCLPIEIADSSDLTFANFHSYRVISSYQPFRYAVTVSRSRDIRFRNFHCYSNSKVSFDASILDSSARAEIRQHEFARLDIADDARLPARKTPPRGPKVEKLASGFYNISGGAVDGRGDFYFVDAHWNRIYKWDAAAQELSTVSDAPLSPVNLAVNASGDLLVYAYAGRAVVYSVNTSGAIALVQRQPAAAQPGKTLWLPVSDWRVNAELLSHPAADFISLDGTAVLPAGSHFLDGVESWGVKSSPEIRSFGLARAVPGRKFYVTDESNLRTWSADVGPNGALNNFRLFCELGGEGVASDDDGSVYLAAGQICIYDGAGKPTGEIDVPERPVQLAFGSTGGWPLWMEAMGSRPAYTMR